MSNSRIFIHANNVHSGGGRKLLISLLNAVIKKYEWYGIFDQRLSPLDDVDISRIKWVPRSVFGRFKSERWLSKSVLPSDIVICLGNLPPLFTCRGRVIVFVQNRYLVDSSLTFNNPLSVKLRIYLERLWLTLRSSNVNLFVVQTSSMKTLLFNLVGSKINISILPFIDCKDGYSRVFSFYTNNIFDFNDCNTRKYDFLYVASGEPHKNHHNLITAWILLAKEGLFPSLCLTVDGSQSSEVIGCIEEAKFIYGLKLTNVGVVASSVVNSLYHQSNALIYPSLMESLGLPLIEARQAGLQVLAPELDYVRDVVDPDQLFDANSPISIARAVKRFLGIEEHPLPLINADEFINSIL
jgi:glycosyltransferase involved in cell wall biosynthesis